MLEKIEVQSIDELFSDIPEAIGLKQPLNLPPSMAEAEVMAEMEDLAAKNTPKLLFAGCGMYDHIIPAVVPHLTGRAEFVTAYTPYQPEISQGILQVLFEFQSAIAEITGLPVSNASLYDGATAAAEACAMAINARRKSRVILVAGTVHPHTRRVLSTYFEDLNVEIRDLEESNGRIDLASLTAAGDKAGSELAGVLVQTPNFYGALEDLSGWADAITPLGHPSDAADLRGDLRCREHPAQTGLGTLAEFDLDRSHRVCRDGCTQLFEVESSVGVARSEVAAPELPDQLAALLVMG